MTQCLWYNAAALPWQSAESACAIHGFQLVTLESKAKEKLVNDYLVKVAGNEITNPDSPGFPVWVGCRASELKYWQWEDRHVLNGIY